MNILPTMSCLAALAAPLAAQCNVAVGSIAYGSACNPVFQQLPSLGVGLDPATCQLQLTVNTFPGCCNTYLLNRLFVLGTSQVNVPLPQFGQGCALLASPDVFLLLPGAAGDTFSMPVPRLPLPFTFFAQGAAHYFTTIGLSNDFALTEGQQVTIR